MEIGSLVLDANYFINRSENVTAAEYYTTAAVISEIKDEESFRFYEEFKAVNKLEILEPDAESLALIKSAVTALNIFAQLSPQDMGVVALAVELSHEMGIPVSEVAKIDYSQFELDETVRPVEFEEITESEDEGEEEELQSKYEQDFTVEDEENLRIAQECAQATYSEDGWVENKRRKKVEVKRHYAESAADFGNGEWITAENVNSHLQMTDNSEITVCDEEIALGVFTEDKGMQNLILALGIKLVNSQQHVIAKVKHFALKCSSCRRVFFDADEVMQYHRNLPFAEEFANEGITMAIQLHCPYCSNIGLMRVAVYIENGKITTTKGIKHFNLKGTVYNLADLTKNRFAGYKKSYLLHPELYEEHRIKNAKYERKNAKPAEFGDDLMKGVGKTSESSDVAYFLRKNPNVRKRKEIVK